MSSFRTVLFLKIGKNCNFLWGHNKDKETQISLQTASFRNIRPKYGIFQAILYLGHFLELNSKTLTLCMSIWGPINSYCCHFLSINYSRIFSVRVYIQSTFRHNPLDILMIDSYRRPTLSMDFHIFEQYLIGSPLKWSIFLEQKMSISQECSTIQDILAVSPSVHDNYHLI